MNVLDRPIILLHILSLADLYIICIELVSLHHIPFGFGFSYEYSFFLHFRVLQENII